MMVVQELKGDWLPGFVAGLELHGQGRPRLH